MAPEGQQRVLAGNNDPGWLLVSNFFPMVTGADPLSVGVNAMDVSPRREMVVAYISRKPDGSTQFSMAELAGTTWTMHTIPGEEPRTSNLSLGIGPDKAPQLAWLANDTVRYWR